MGNTYPIIAIVVVYKLISICCLYGEERKDLNADKSITRDIGRGGP
jgi:hypothetical protein